MNYDIHKSTLIKQFCSSIAPLLVLHKVEHSEATEYDNDYNDIKRDNFHVSP